MTDLRGTFERRKILKMTAAGVAVAPLTGCSGNTSASDGESRDFDGWFSDVSNYNGVVDRTGKNETEVVVGAKGNEGAGAFAPAAVKVAPGTTVVWKWKGGMHNVVAEDGSFESEVKSGSDITFEHTFEEAGTYKYVCTPHEQMGMKGAVVCE